MSLLLHTPFGRSQIPEIAGAGIVTKKCPVSAQTPDGEVLFTVPDGHRLRLSRAYWHVTTDFTGGASSAIGLDSNNAAYSTPGDLLGGAGGDVAAGLTAGFRGTAGAKVGSAAPIILGPGDTVRFQRIASAFTAGAGFAVLEFVAVEEV